MLEKDNAYLTGEFWQTSANTNRIHLECKKMHWQKLQNEKLVEKKRFPAIRMQRQQFVEVSGVSTNNVLQQTTLQLILSLTKMHPDFLRCNNLVMHCTVSEIVLLSVRWFNILHEKACHFLSTG